MRIDNFHEKISLALSFFILNNYFLLSIGFSNILIKINFLFFLITILIFYFKNILENPFLKIFFFLIILICLGTPISEWDPRTTWFFHAKRIFFDQSIFSIADNYAPHSHNDYPTLAPAFAASFAILIGHWNEVFPKLSFLLMFLPPLILTYSFFNSTFYLVFLSIVFFTIGKFLFNGWVDGLLAVYFGLSAFLMNLLVLSNNYSFKKNPILYLIALCFFVSLTLIKNEGLVLLLILFVITFLIKLFKKDLKNNISTLTFLSFAFLPIFLWKFFVYSQSISHEVINSNILVNLTFRFADFSNYKIISYFLLLNEKFIITLIFFLLSFWVNRNTDILRFVLLVTFSYIFVLFFVYLSTPLDFYFQIDSTASRIMRTLSFLLAFFGLYNLSLMKTKKL